MGLTSDDAYAETHDGWPGYSETDVSQYVGYPGSNGPVVGGWRWTGLAIPPGAIILQAYAEFCQSGYGDDITTTLTFQNVSSPATFSSASTPASRIANHTAFSVAWTWGGPRSPGTWFETSSLAAGIQELVNRYGGIDAVALLEDGAGIPQGMHHSWTTYDLGTEFAAKLHVTYRL